MYILGEAIRINNSLANENQLTEIVSDEKMMFRRPWRRGKKRESEVQKHPSHDSSRIRRDATCSVDT